MLQYDIFYRKMTASLNNASLASVGFKHWLLMLQESVPEAFRLMGSSLAGTGIRYGCSRVVNRSTKTGLSIVQLYVSL